MRTAVDSMLRGEKGEPTIGFQTEGVAFAGAWRYKIV